MSRQFKSESGMAIMGGELVTVNAMKSQAAIDKSKYGLTTTTAKHRNNTINGIRLRQTTIIST